MKKKRSALTWILVGSIVLGVIAAVAVSVAPSPDAAPVLPEQLATEHRLDELSSAQSVCEDFVMKSVHDPSDAKMEDFRTYPVTPGKGKGAGEFEVQVSGRARNGFNAMRQLVVNCRVRHEKTGWRLVALKELH